MSRRNHIFCSRINETLAALGLRLCVQIKSLLLAGDRVENKGATKREMKPKIRGEGRREEDITCQRI